MVTTVNITGHKMFIDLHRCFLISCSSLVYDKNKTMFYTGQPPFKNVTRHLAVTNTFNFTVVIYNVSLPKDGQRYFSVSSRKVLKDWDWFVTVSVSILTSLVFLNILFIIIFVKFIK